MIDVHIIKVLAAVNLRNRCATGLESVDWIKEQAAALVEAGFWNESQIAEICGLTRQAVSTMARRGEAVRPAERPQGGKLVAGALDAILELQGQVKSGRGYSREILRRVISTGTSTKLISRLTDIPIGTILYEQRKLKEEK